MNRLEGKVAVVTGSSKGIGAAIAEDLAAEGASVVVNYSKSANEAEAVVARIRGKGGKATAIQADVSHLPEARDLIEKTVQEFGGLDILVNNAAVFEFIPLAEVTEAHFDKHFNTNVKGLLFATQAAVNAFNGKGGSIINISSVAAQSPPPNSSVYAATKSAIDGITKSLAAELGPRQILVNSVLPGFTDTDGVRAMPQNGEFRERFVLQTPLGRVGKPQDIARVVSFLVSDDARWVTGQLIPVSGGLR